MISGKKRNSIRNALLQGGFGAGVRDLPVSDPPTSALIEVDIDIDTIQPYDLNPRTTGNPAFFARLCDSIRAQGLDNPIPVTRRPGEAHYRVAAGGNTRLRALTHLHAEDPERFAKVPCIFRRYTSEIDLITAHLRENELRDSLIFVDHAHAIVALRRRLDEESESGPLSDSAYERWLMKAGHQVSRRDIGRMEYAVNWLDEAIPVALRHDGGIGPRLIDLIGNLHRHYAQFWDDLDPEVRGSTAFDPLFLNVLSAHDGEALPIDLIKDALVRRVEEVTGLSSNLVKAQVEALMGVSGYGGRASDRSPLLPMPPADPAIAAPPPSGDCSAEGPPDGTDPQPASILPEVPQNERTSLPDEAPGAVESPREPSPDGGGAATIEACDQPALAPIPLPLGACRTFATLSVKWAP